MTMHILEKYIEAMNAGDADKLALLFAEDCAFNDSGSRPLGFPDINAEGREAVRKTFAGVFAKVKAKSEMLSIDGNEMKYNVMIGKYVVPCTGIVEEEKGLIKKLTIIPREQS